MVTATVAPAGTGRDRSTTERAAPPANRPARATDLPLITQISYCFPVGAGASLEPTSTARSPCPMTTVRRAFVRASGRYVEPGCETSFPAFGEAFAAITVA